MEARLEMVLARSDYCLSFSRRSGKFRIYGLDRATLCFIVVFVHLSWHGTHTLFSIERSRARMDTRYRLELCN